VFAREREKKTEQKRVRDDSVRQGGRERES